jgi:PAS domain S-box-containing protein
MKAMVRRLKDWFSQLSPLPTTAIGLCLVLGIGVLDYYTPRSMSFTLIYLLIVAFVGWGAGKWPAAFISAAIVFTAAMAQWILPRNFPHPGWVVWWNAGSRLLAYACAGWVMAEVAGLNRSLRRSVEERTAQLKGELEQHKATGSRLAEINERFEQVINNITEAFWLRDLPKSQLAFVSPGYERIWGRKCEELYREPRSWIAAVHPADRDEVLRRAQTDQVAGKYDVEYRIVRPDGAVRWIRDRGFPVRNEEGRVYRIAGIAQDITERKQTREVLQMQASILENMAEGVVVTDEQGVIVQMNPAGERLWGYQRNEVLGQPVSVLSALPEPEKTANLQEVLAAMRATGSWSGTFQDRRKDGTIIWCHAVMNRLEIEGRVLYVALEQDVTEQKRAEEAVRQSEQSLRACLDAIPEAALLLDRNGVILVGNQALARRLGLAEAEMTGKHAFDLMPSEIARSRKERFEQVLRTGQAVQFEDERNGRYFINYISPVVDAAGTVTRLAVLGLDITERKRSELMTEAFLALGTKLAAAAQPLEAARAIQETADQLWACDCGALDMCLPDPGLSQTLLAWDVVAGKRCTVTPLQRTFPASGRARRIMSQGAELILRQPGEKPTDDFIPIGDTSRLSASLMYVPVRREGRSVGVFTVQSYTRNAYTPEDLRTLQAMADYCGGALERLSLEAEAREREALNRTILETAMDGYYILDFASDHVGRFVEVNDAYCRMTGYTREELLQKRLSDLEVVESPADVARHAEKIAAHQGDRFETQHRRKDGQEVQVELSVSLLPGRPGSTFTFVRDITERKRAEMALRESEQKYRALVETTGTGYLILDMQGRVLDANAAYVRLSGHRTLEEILGRSVVEWTALEDQQRNAAAVEECLRTGAVRNLEVTYAGPDGRSTPVEVSGTVVRTPAGDSVLSLCWDVTQRKQTERELARREELYRTLFELSPDGILLEDTDGNILDVNEALCHAFGYAREELVQRHVRCLAPAANAGQVEEHLTTLRAGQMLEHEVPSLRKNGESCLMRLKEQPLRLPGGRQGILVVARDVTASRRAEETREAFMSLGGQLSTARSPVEAARAIYAAADQLWKWDAGVLTLRLPDSDQVSTVLGWDLTDGERGEIAPAPPGTTPTERMRRIMAKGAELILRKPGEQPTDHFRPFGDTSRLAASLMYVPVRREGQAIGILSLQSYTPNAYTPEDLRTLQALADYCGGALERLRAEQALHESEELNRTILTTTMDAFYSLDFAADPGGAITGVNDAFCRLTGYSREELLQMRMADLEAVESPEEVAEHGRRIIASGGHRFESRHRRKDGREIHTELCVSRLGSHAERVFGFIRDITERKRAELMREAFLSLGAKLGTASSAVGAARSVYAASDRLWEWDSAALTLYDAESDLMEPVLFCDVIDGKRTEVAPPRAKAPPTPRMRQIMKQGALILRKEGDAPDLESQRFGDLSRASASILSVPLRREGQPIGILSIQSYTANAFTQVDLQTLQALGDYCGGALERIRAEQALKEQGEQLHAFYDSPGGLRGIIELLEDDARFISANQAEAAIFGRTVEQMRSVRVTELGLPRPFLELWLARLRESQQCGGAVSFEYSSDFRFPGGWGLATVCPLGQAGSSRPRFAFLAVDITDRKRAEAALLESHGKLEQRVRERTAALQAANTALSENEARLKLALHASKAGIWSWDMTTGQAWWDDRYGELCELDPHAPKTSETWMARLHPEDRKRLQATIADLLEDSSSDAWDVEFRVVLPSFGERWMASLGRIERDAAGRAEFVTGLSLDITERKRAEETQRAQLSYIEAIYQNAPVGLCVLDVGCRYVRINDRLAALNRVPVEQHLGRTLREVLPPPVGEPAEAICRQVIATGQPMLDVESQGQDPAEPGKVRAALTHWAPLRGADGQITGVSVVVEEITERIRAQEAQRSQLAYIEAIYQNAPVGLCVLDTNLRYLRINQRLAGMNGLTAEQHLGRTVREAVPHLAAGTEAICREVIATGKPVLNLELTGTTAAQPDVSRSWITSWMPLKEADGRVSGVSVVVEEITERKRMDQALRESEAKYRRLHETMRDAFVQVEMDGRITEFNRAYEALLGYSREELPGLTYQDLTPERWRDLEAQVVAEQILPRGYSEVYEKEYRRKDGTLIPIELRTILLRDGNEQPSGMWAIVRDITERKQAEQALREAHDKLEQRVRERTAALQAANAALAESEERYRSLVNNLNVGVYRNRPGSRGAFVSANPALARIHGYDSMEEFLKIKVTDLYEDPRERQKFLEDLMHRGTLLDYELRLKRKDGTPIFASVNATAHRGPDGKVDWIDGVLEDTTRRKQAEAALRASEERYRALTEASPDAICILDRDFKVQYVNSGAAALWQRQPTDLIGRLHTELFAPDVAQRHAEAVGRVLATGEPTRREDVVTLPTGDQWIDIRLVPLVDEAGAVTSVMEVCRDVTERKHAERQLAEALDLNEKMVAASGLGIAAYKASGECVLANVALASILGGTVAAVREGNFRNLKAWQESGLLQLAEHALGQNRAQSGECSATTRFGKPVWLDCHVAPFVSKGEPHLLLMALDISRRKQAEEALRAAERLPKAILNHIPDPAWLKDAQGRFLGGNHALAKFYGRSPEAITGKTVFDCIPAEAARMTREDQKVMTTRRPVVSEALITDAQGRPRWFESVKSPLLNERGDVSGTVGIARDITERKQTEILLHVQRDLAVGLGQTSDLETALKRLLETAIEMGGVDSGGIYLLNPTTGGMELVVHQGISASFLKAVSRWDSDGPQVRLVRHGRPYFGLYQDLPIRHDEPRQREGLLAFALLPLNHKRKVIGTLSLASHTAETIPAPTRLVLEAIAAQAAGAMARISAEVEQHRLERQILEISDREQARIGQDIHDGLCQQLVSLAFDANSLKQEFVGQRRPEARKVRRIAAGLDRAITETRQLARGLFPVRLEQEGLAPALEELAQATTARFKIRCHFDSRGPVAVDNATIATHLFRIAQEAVANAVRHSRARRLAIRLRGRAGRLELTIADSGAGIPVAQRKKTTGMGLHILDYRARTIGAELRVGPGRRGGTVVSCCIPQPRR